jgi:hypothetical protein
MTDDELSELDNLICPEVSTDNLLERVDHPYDNTSRTLLAATRAYNHEHIRHNGEASHDNVTSSHLNFGNPPEGGIPFYQNRQNNGRIDSPMMRHSHQQSPIRVYDENECSVRKPMMIVPFSCESVNKRIKHLETTASITLP